LVVFAADELFNDYFVHIVTSIADY